MSASLALVLFAVLGMVLAAPSSPARADTGSGTVLPFHYFGHLVADHVHDVAYVDGSDRSGSGEVAVVDATGAIVKSFGPMSSPAGMALSDHGATLFVLTTNGSGQEIVSIDVASGAQRTYDLEEPIVVACDADLALVDGRLWFSRCPTGNSAAGLGSLDPVTGSVQTSSVVPFDVKNLAAVATLPHHLVVSADGDLYNLDVATDSTGSAVASVAAVRTGVDAAAISLSLSGDGSQVLVGNSVFRTSDLARVDQYPAYGGVASAEAADGTVAVGSAEDDNYPAVFVYRPGHTVFAEQTSYGFQQSGESVFTAWNGLAFGTTSLFAVAWSGQAQVGANPVIHVTHPSPPPDPIGARDFSLLGTGQLVSDPAHLQTFLNTGGGGNGLLVLDEQGHLVHVVQHLPGISEMALAGNTLWMALRGADAIAAMDTRTYAVRTYPLGTGSAPVSLAVQAGKVWFSHRARSFDVFGLDSLNALDPATGKVDRLVAPIVATSLSASPAHPHSIYGVGETFPGDNFTNAAEIRIRVSGGSRPTASYAAGQAPGYNPHDSIETPDVLHVAYAAEAPSWMALDAETLAGVGTPQNPIGSPNLVGVAVRSDGLVARAYVCCAFPHVITQFGAVGPLQSTFRVQPGEPAVSGLAFGADDLHVLAGVVVPGQELDSYRVRNLPVPARQKVTLTTDRQYYDPGHSVRIVAHVEPRLLPQSPRVSVEVRPSGGTTRTLVVGARPDARGNVALTTTFGRPLTLYAQVRYGGQKATFRTCRNRVTVNRPCAPFPQG